MKTELGPIDIVYCWCDSADPVFSAKMNALKEKLGMVIDKNDGANGACRYQSNDELKYSLRSLEQCAPWINRVFLVVDDDIALPAWLNEEHPKLTIIRLSQIVPQEILPLFNAISIEFHIPFIPGLSEHFLYANDDMLFASKVKPNFFFAGDGYPIFRYLKSRVNFEDTDIKDAYIHEVAYSKRFVRCKTGVCGDFKKSINYLPHHNIDAYRKSDTLAFMQAFESDVKKVASYPFRDRNQFQRDVWASYAMAIGHGHFRFTQRPWWETIFGKPHRESWYYSLGKKEKNFKRIRPKLFCVNDNPAATPEDIKTSNELLKNTFPTPSSFEKESVK